MLKRWYYQMLMEEFGPVEVTTIRQLVEDGTLSSTDLVRAEDSSEWITVASGEWSAGPDDYEPDPISDLSELSFTFEESAPSDPRTPRETDGQASIAVPPQYYSRSLGQVLGPMSMDDLIGMAESGALTHSDEVRFGETSDWQAAGDLSELTIALSMGEQLTGEPVASAPPSTRRLFPTSGKPVEYSPSQAAVTSPHEAAASENIVLDTTAALVPPETAPVPPENEASSSKPPAVSAVADNRAVSRKSSSKDGPAAKGKVRKPKQKKANQEEEKLLDDIFADVFADDQKAVRPGMPPTSAKTSTPKPNATTATPATLETASNSDEEPVAEIKSPVATAVTPQPQTVVPP